MSERENKTPSGAASRVLRCDEWENLIADALDATLTAADAAAFTRHHSECALCAQMFKETQQGKDWMQYLAAEPEVPDGLLQKILARTSERPEWASSSVAQPSVAAPTGPRPARPAGTRAFRLPALVMSRQWARQWAHQVLEPRLMMTLAMAFFSIALTLNLTGIHLTQIRPADLQPSRLRATLTRQYYSTNQQVTKYYENLRLVYEMEARVRELRRSSEAAPAPQAAPPPNPPIRQRDGTGAPTSTVSPDDAQPQPQNRRAHGKATVAPPTLMVNWLPRSPARAASASPLSTGSHQFSPSGEGVRPGIVVPQVFRAFPSTPDGPAKRSLV